VIVAYCWLEIQLWRRIPPTPCSHQWTL